MENRSKKLKSLSFTGIVYMYPGINPWHMIRVPKEITETIHHFQKNKKCILVPIMATIDTSTWRTSLLPARGNYLIAIKKQIRKEQEIFAGDSVTISFSLV